MSGRLGNRARTLGSGLRRLPAETAAGPDAILDRAFKGEL